MTCYYPIRAYILSDQKTENGKAVIVFDLGSITGESEKIDLPCGRCIGCKLDKSRDWATRCIHEAQIQDQLCYYNSFITLTFDDEHNKITLVKDMFPKFIKRLRKWHSKFRYNPLKGEWYERPKDCKPHPIRYFQCGEYGETCRECDKPVKLCQCDVFKPGPGRPHHHACIFGWNWPDKVLTEVSENGMCYYESEQLAKLWTFGRHIIGELTWESAAYVARYCCKKITGEAAEKHYQKLDRESGEILQLVPEFVTMSRRPGIGQQWFEKYGGTVHTNDSITHEGRSLKVPKYYDRKCEQADKEVISRVKELRIERMSRHADDNTLLRLRSREKVKKRQCKILERNL